MDSDHSAKTLADYLQGRQLLFVFPASAGERLLESGLADCLHAEGIEYAVSSYRKMPQEQAMAWCRKVLQDPEVGCVVYPEFDSLIWRWEGALSDWFFPSNTGPGIEIESQAGLLGGMAMLKLIRACGVPTIGMPCHYGGPFDFEIQLSVAPDLLSQQVMHLLALETA